jgi:hypothetical protein
LRSRMTPRRCRCAGTARACIKTWQNAAGAWSSRAFRSGTARGPLFEPQKSPKPFRGAACVIWHVHRARTSGAGCGENMGHAAGPAIEALCFQVLNTMGAASGIQTQIFHGPYSTSKCKQLGPLSRTLREQFNSKKLSRSDLQNNKDANIGIQATTCGMRVINLGRAERNIYRCTHSGACRYGLIDKFIRFMMSQLQMIEVVLHEVVLPRLAKEFRTRRNPTPPTTRRSTRSRRRISNNTSSSFSRMASGSYGDGGSGHS